MPKINLESNDGRFFRIDVKVAEKSGMIRTMIEDLGLDENEEEILRIPNVNGVILEKVIEWSEYYQDSPPESEPDTLIKEKPEVINEFDDHFLDVDQGTLFELILAANYLDIKDLLDACSKKVAKFMIGKSACEIREIFNIRNDFTPEEEIQMFEENTWCLKK